MNDLSKPAPPEPLTTAYVRDSYAAPAPVAHYARAVHAVGLWRSEWLMVRRYVLRDARLLDLGCGAGRTTLGLARLGYHRIHGVDISPAMIAKARTFAKAERLAALFTVGDVLALPWPDSSFDAALFSFNGLMQVPGRARRVEAMREIRRVLRPGGVFIFTTHDSAEMSNWAGYWKAEARRWRNGRHDPRLTEQGDTFTDHGGVETFLHIPARDEVLACLAEAGLVYLADHWRTELCQEPPEVEEFSNPCRFWVAVRPVEQQKAGNPGEPPAGVPGAQ